MILCFGNKASLPKITQEIRHERRRSWIEKKWFYTIRHSIIYLGIRSISLPVPSLQIVASTNISNPQIPKSFHPNNNLTLPIMHYPTLLLALFTTAALAKDPWVRSYYNADCNSRRRQSQHQRGQLRQI